MQRSRPGPEEPLQGGIALRLHPCLLDLAGRDDVFAGRNAWPLPIYTNALPIPKLDHSKKERENNLLRVQCRSELSKSASCQCVALAGKCFASSAWFSLMAASQGKCVV